MSKGRKGEGNRMASKVTLQFSVPRRMWPYILLPLAGTADLITTFVGTRVLSMVEGNAHYIPFLAQTVIILNVFLVRRIRIFPIRILKACEVGLVIYSFLPAVWNLSLILLHLFH
jgi:hypothetical protein